VTRPARAWLFALLALAAGALFVRLGVWQWHRGQDAEAAGQRFARGADRLVSVGAAPLADLPLYQRVTVTGELDGVRQFLLDNRSYQGNPGYEVLTLLTRAGGTPLLVDRGWVPFSGSRARLPQVDVTRTGPVTLSGRLGLLPSAGLAFGRAPPEGAWPKVTSFPTMDELAAALGQTLEPRVLLLDPQAPQGYVRDWQAPGMSPLRHFAYAIQWWCFATVTLLTWGLLSYRAQRRKHT
jgi:cytochrome oxidase assembly protein ShyY1